MPPERAVVADRGIVVLPRPLVLAAVLATGIGGVVIGGLLHPVEPARIVARVARAVARPAAQRHRLRKVEPLHEEVEPLLELEIGLQGTVVRGVAPQRLDRGQGVEIVDRGTRPRPVGVAHGINRAGVFGKVVPQVARGAVGVTAVFDPAPDIDLGLQETEEVHIEVRADIVAVDACVGQRIVGRGVVDSPLPHVAEQHEIAYGLVAARDRHVGIGIGRGLLGDLAVPVHVGQSGDLVGRVIGCPNVAVVVAQRLVVKPGIVARTQRVLEVHGLLHAAPDIDRDARAADTTALGRDPNHAVGAPHAEGSQRRGILQHLDPVDLGRREKLEISHIGLEAVDIDRQRRVVVGRHAADTERSGIVAGFPVGLRHDEPRDTSVKHVVDIGRGDGYLVSRHGRDGRSDQHCLRAGRCPGDHIFQGRTVGLFRSRGIPGGNRAGTTDGQNRECRASEKHTFHMVGIHVILIFSVNDCVWADQYPGFCTR